MIKISGPLRSTITPPCALCGKFLVISTSITSLILELMSPNKQAIKKGNFSVHLIHKNGRVYMLSDEKGCNE